MKTPVRLSKAFSVFVGISIFGVSVAHSHPLPEDNPNIEQKHKIEDMKNRQNAQKLKIQKLRADADARRAITQSKAMERRRLHEQKRIKRRAEQEAEKARRLNFKTQLLNMLVHDGVIDSKEQSVMITYREGHPIANNVNLYARYGDKYNKLWTAYGFILSDDSYMNISPRQYEIREITQNGTSRHYQVSSSSAQ